MLYRIYPSESAGNALAFKFTPPVFKVLISIPTAVFISLLVKSFIGASGTKWIIILSMLAIVLLCGLIEFIYWQDLKMLLKGWRSSVIAIGFVAVLLAVFQFDFTGYDTYLPKEEKNCPDRNASRFVRILFLVSLKTILQRMTGKVSFFPMTLTFYTILRNRESKT